jgi:hypothetical protein
MESSVPSRDPVLLNDWHPVAIAGQLGAGCATTEE